MAVVTWNIQFFIILHIISVFTAGATAYHLFRRRNAPGALYFALMMISIMIWITGSLIEISSSHLSNKILGLQIQYFFGIPLIPVFWLLASIDYLTLGKRPSRLGKISVMIIPLITISLSSTMNLHALLYTNFRMQNYGPFQILKKDPGIWFYVQVVYSYCAIAAGTVLLLCSLKRSAGVYKVHSILFLTALFLPWISNIVYLCDMNSFMPIDVTPVAFIFSVLILNFSIFRFGLFDLVPAARDKLIESMDDTIIVIDKYDRIIDMNQAAHKMYPDKVYVGMPLSDLSRRLYDLRNTNSDGLTSHTELMLDYEAFDLSISEFKDKVQNVAGKILVLHNITERKKIEKELRNLNTMKDKFFSILAHDLRSPFQGLLGLSGILCTEGEELSVEERQEFSRKLYEGLITQFNLLDDLLTWNRFQRGMIEFDPKINDISGDIRDACSVFEETIGKKGLNLVLSLPEKLNAVYDKNMISGVLRNLLSNAVKFTNPGGEIKIEVDSSENETKVSFSDTGVGIREENIGKLFRIDLNFTTPGTNEESGTGLGLILASDFITIHGGVISVKSRPGEGSCFSFTIPALAPKATETATVLK
jgi:signal transduction histidine kinase